MIRFVFVLSLATASLPGIFAAGKPTICGTSRGKTLEELALHNHAARLEKRLALRAAAPPAAAAGRDVGNIAILEDSGDLVIRRKIFNLDKHTISYQPSSGFKSYSYLVSGPGFDRDAAQNGIPLDRPADDGASAITLPFNFPLYGQFYNQAFVDSDGNIQFGSSSSGGDRSLGQFLTGAPRIAPLFTDLDPTSGGSIRVFSDAGRVVVSWVNVPEYSDNGLGRVQTFQARLYADGHIEFAYDGVTLENAVVGLSPGGGAGDPAIVDYLAEPSGHGGSSIAEVFSDSDRVDMVGVARRFYQTHEDSYDYLMVYNNMGVRALDAVAYELPVRTTAKGFGDLPVDVGASYGSRRRLQAVINLGPLNQYPTNPDGHVVLRGATKDTGVSIMAHETGHLFLAYVSVPDPDDPDYLPMLGFQRAHWAFTFNSEASLLEGNKIQDNGAGQTPRFLTVDNVQVYSPLDQYLMGFRAPKDVPPTFVITSPSIGTGYMLPRTGVPINGGRRDISVQDVIAVAGPRIPDSTVAQRHFRFGIILVVALAQSAQPDIDKLEAYRQRFEPFYRQASSENGWADTTIRKSVAVSVAPAAGLVAGGSLTASITLETPAGSDLSFKLMAGAGNIAVPGLVTIPAGRIEASFDLRGLTAGVDDLVIQPADERYETVNARIPVASSASVLRVQVLSGDGQVFTAGQALEPIRIRVTDANELPYPGLKILASTGAGSVAPDGAITDASGTASFNWTGAGAGAALTLRLENGQSVEVRTAGGDTRQTRPPRHPRPRPTALQRLSSR